MGLLQTRSVGLSVASDCQPSKSNIIASLKPMAIIEWNDVTPILKHAIESVGNVTESKKKPRFKPLFLNVFFAVKSTWLLAWHKR